MLLAVAVNPAHALFETGRIPGDVVIDHDPAELEVDTLGSGIGTDHQPRSALLGGNTEALDLVLAFREVHATVDLGDVTRVSEAA